MGQDCGAWPHAGAPSPGGCRSGVWLRWRRHAKVAPQVRRRAHRDGCIHPRPTVEHPDQGLRGSRSSEGTPIQRLVRVPGSVGGEVAASSPTRTSPLSSPRSALGAIARVSDVRELRDATAYAFATRLGEEREQLLELLALPRSQFLEDIGRRLTAGAKARRVRGFLDRHVPTIAASELHRRTWMFGSHACPTTGIPLRAVR
jgi:hypothetical protein